MQSGSGFVSQTLVETRQYILLIQVIFERNKLLWEHYSILAAVDRRTYITDVVTSSYWLVMALPNMSFFIQLFLAGKSVLATLLLMSPILFF